MWGDVVREEVCGGAWRGAEMSITMATTTVRVGHGE